jgi:LmbE family N-acetylglucosaminyl deacetylase
MAKRLIVAVAHPDDDILTFWPYIHYIAYGYEVHLIWMTRGEVTPASLGLDGSKVCPGHGYTHNPWREHYVVPTEDEIGLARLREGYSSAGAMAMIPPYSGFTTQPVIVHDENSGTAYGCSGCGSSQAPTTPEGVALADAMFKKYMTDYPNSLFWTHSPTDAHPDHAALGKALRALKLNTDLAPEGWGEGVTYADALVNSRFFVSKLYWSTPAGQLGSRLSEPCAWYPNSYPNNLSDAELNFTRRVEYTNWIKNFGVKPYTESWNPVDESWAIGGKHSTPGQFGDCFGPAITQASALWHA